MVAPGEQPCLHLERHIQVQRCEYSDSRELRLDCCQHLRYQCTRPDLQVGAEQRSTACGLAESEL